MTPRRRAFRKWRIILVAFVTGFVLYWLVTLPLEAASTSSPPKDRSLGDPPFQPPEYPPWKNPGPPARILVHYVYYEHPRLPDCELINKRANLATFLLGAVATAGENVEFVFTISGKQPSDKDFWQSLHLDVKPMFPEAPNVHVRSPGASVFGPQLSQTPDLCYHAEVIHSLNSTYDYVLLTNDGMRGPFLDSRRAELAVRGLRMSQVPLWLAELVAQFEADPLVGLGGAVLSCEEDVHLQGWWHLVRGDQLGVIVERYKDACDPRFSWRGFVLTEVALSTDFLEKGMRITSLYPRVAALSQADREHIRLHPAFPMLRNCSNPLAENHNLSLTQMITIKFGGDMLRQRVYSEELFPEISEATAIVLGPSVNSCHYGQGSWLRWQVMLVWCGVGEALLAMMFLLTSFTPMLRKKD